MVFAEASINLRLGAGTPRAPHHKCSEGGAPAASRLVGSLRNL